MSPIVLADPTPAPVTTPSCAQASDFCQYIYHRTGLPWLAESSYYLLVKPLRVLLIVMLAVLARHALHKMINRLVRSTADDAPSLLRPLHERIPDALREATGVVPERRRQRAEALGSVMRSTISATIFAVAVMLILGELGINLAPLLASAGIAGLAIGFGAQNLVKDFIAGLFMLLEDQYGVGDVVDVGEATGTVEAVGLRVTTIRDPRGVVWYIRNGEIVRVGNKSQGWAVIVVDVPVGFAGLEEATDVLRTAARRLADDPPWCDDILEAPDVLGVEHLTVDGAVLRTTVKTTSAGQWRVGRELRRRLTEALQAAGIAAQISSGRVYIRPPTGDAAPVELGDPALDPVLPGTGDATGRTGDGEGPAGGRT